MDKEELKQKLLKDMEDLTNKIINEEPTPDKEFDVDLIDTVDELINEALSCWYY